MKYPNDATGEALRGLAASGSDMNKPMSIDFIVAAPSEQAAHAIAEAATALGYAVEVSPDEDDVDDDIDDDGMDDDGMDDDGMDDDGMDDDGMDDDGMDEGELEEDELDDANEDEDVAHDDDNEGGAEATWTCNCVRRLVPTYAAIVAAQAELDALAKPHGGYADGWGSFGNKEDIEVN